MERIADLWGGELEVQSNHTAGIKDYNSDFDRLTQFGRVEKVYAAFLLLRGDRSRLIRPKSVKLVTAVITPACARKKVFSRSSRKLMNSGMVAVMAANPRSIFP